MKIGRNCPRCAARSTVPAGLTRAIYVERGTMANAQSMPLTDKLDDAGALFRMVLVPGWEGRHVSGSLPSSASVPATSAVLTPEAEAALAAADALYGYGALSRPRAGARRPDPPCLRQSRGGRARQDRAAPRCDRRARRGRLGRRSRRVRHGGCRLRGDRGRARRVAKRSTSRSCRASPPCWRSRRGSARRSATISAPSRCPTI